MPILSTNVDAGNANAYKFTASDISLTIMAGVAISSDNGWDAIYANGHGSETIYNAGIVTGGSAVDVEDGTNIVSNGATGILIGLNGIVANGAFNNLSNAGAIFASGDGILASGDHCSVVNSGSINGLIGVDLNGTGDSLDNTGRITGSSQTDGHSIRSSGSGLILRNFGTLDGDVDLAGSGSLLRNRGTILGDVEFGSGANTFNGAGGTVDGVITGGSDADTVHLGADGETVNGGGGHDALYGGAGADVFAFSSNRYADYDNVHNFNVNNDKIELYHSVFTALSAGVPPVFFIGSAANSASDHLFYNNANGNLEYDADGNGTAHAPLVFANVGAGLKLTANNFIVV